MKVPSEGERLLKEMFSKLNEVRALGSALAEALEIEPELEPEPQTQRRAPGRIIVTMPDETVIYKRFAADTFADAIERLGVERVKNLGITVNARPLVSENPPSGTSGYRERSDVFIYIGDTGTENQKTDP